MKEDNTIFVYVDPEVKEIVKKLASDEGRSISNWTKKLIIQEINKYNANPEHYGLPKTQRN